MAAGLGFKTFTTGEVLSAADVNGYLMQGINVFADATARDAAITSPQEGQFAYTKDNNSLWYYSGSAWVASGATGDIEGVSVTSPITGGGTSGTVTIGIDSTAVVPSQTGNSGKYLTTNGTSSSWGTISAGSMTSLATGSMSGVSTITISSISSSYRDLRLVLRGYGHAALSDGVKVRINGVTTGSYGDLQNTGGSAPGQTGWTSGAFCGVGTTANLNLTMLNYSISGINKICTWQGDYPGNTNYNMYYIAANSTITNAITSITFFSNNNFTSGTYELLGIN